MAALWGREATQAAKETHYRWAAIGTPPRLKDPVHP
jgi:hypothetical protein